MKKTRYALKAAIVLAGMSPLISTALAGVRSKMADLVLGQEYYTQNTGTTFSGLYGIAIDTTTGRLYTSESTNNRILWWDNLGSIINGQAADGVLGQGTFSANSSATTQTGLNYPQGIFVDGAGDLWVADRLNRRVLKFTRPSGNGQAAAVVVGQADFTSRGSACSQTGMYYPVGLTVDPAGNLWVADQQCSRVTKYAYPVSSGQAASVVLGQGNFTTTDMAQGQTGLYNPKGVVADGSGNIWVVDSMNSRIVKYSVPVSTFQAASTEIGQVNYTTLDVRQGNTGFYYPSAAAFDLNGDLWVADYANSRALKFNKPFSDAQAASDILCKTDYVSHSSELSQSGCSGITGIAIEPSGNVWVADAGNARVLRFHVFGLTSLSQSTGVNGGPGAVTSFIVNGYDFINSDRVKLTKAGESDIILPAPTLVSDRQMYCAVDLTGKATGYWNIVASTDGFITASATLSNAFLVLSGSVTINSITPNHGTNNASVSVSEIGGLNIPAAAVAKLVKTGESDITASSVSVVSSKELSCVFDLTGKTTGYWDLVVSTGSESYTLAKSFYIDYPVQDAASFTNTDQINPAVAAELTITPPSGEINVAVAAGTFGQTVNLTVSTASAPASLDPIITPSGICLDITNDLGLQPGKEITLVVNYRDSDVAGLDELKLVLCRYDPATGMWTPLPTAVYADVNMLVAKASHLSRFVMVQLLPSAGLAAVKAYPIPYNPSNGSLTIDNLTGQAEIKIYTITGELVRKVGYSSGFGKTTWDGRNDNGSTVASGVYLMLIKSGANTKKLKIAVEK